MTAIRIIDDHTELASIGTNSHADLDAHVSAADNYVKRDGTLPLTADWDIGNGIKILADHIRARDGDGLKLYDDGGNGIFVKDGGNVGIGITAPTAKLDVNSDILRLRTTKTPASAGAAGNQGDHCWDADYVYVCVATNTWKRSALSTW